MYVKISWMLRYLDR